jgi:ABC-2 type transport system ATP-binding protein
MDALIEARGLTKRYGRTIAVDDLSFQVRSGEVTGFVGPNGAGKSTTMRIVLGLDAPNRGSALVHGQPYGQLGTPLREVGALLDAAALHPGRRADHHLLWLAQSNDLPRDRVTEVLELVGLSDVARRRAGGFSLGMRQRLGIAAALLGDPPILIFDEPVNGLDPEGVVWIRGFLRSLAAEGRAVFVSSHLMSELEDTADHLIVIGRGKLIADTSMAGFLAAAAPAAVRVRSSDQDALAGLVRAPGVTVAAADDGALIVTGLLAEQVGAIAGAAGITVLELATVQASLEDVFVDLTQDAVEYRAAI